jgi:hypothetical protein
VIAVRFFAGVAQLAEPVGLAEQDAWILSASRGCRIFDPAPRPAGLRVSSYKDT